MTTDIQLDATAIETLDTLQKLFAPHASVRVIQVNTPSIIKEFRRSVTTDDPALGNLPKPALDFVFAAECGAAQDGTRTFALIFTQFDRLKQFYAENPALNGTLITCWHGAAAIWLRATGRIPSDFAADGVRWCSSGTIPVGCPKQPSHTFISLEGQIKQVDFSQIVWNEPQRAELETIYLEMEVGPPFRIAARGRRLLNAAYWSKFIMGMIRITYDLDGQSFEWSDPAKETSVWRSEDDSLRMLSEFMQVAAKQYPGEFPEGELRSRRMRQILERIKLLAKLDRASGEVLDHFLETQCVRTSGKDITSHEFRAGYVAYCHGLGRAPCSASRFYRALRSKLRGMGIDQRHDILRNGKMVRGYGGLGLKVVQVSDASDTADGADGV